MDKRRSVKAYLKLLRKITDENQTYTLEVFLSNGSKLRLLIRVDEKQDIIYLVKVKNEEIA